MLWLELRVKEQRLLIKTLGGLPKELNFFWGCNSGSLKDLTLGVTFSHLHVRRHPWRECWRWGEIGFQESNQDLVMTQVLAGEASLWQ